MATPKKNKKKATPKKKANSKKTNKKNNGMSFFSKFMLTLLLIAVLATCMLTIIKNISNNDDKIEVSVAETESRKIAETQNSKDIESQGHKVAETTNPKADVHSTSDSQTEQRSSEQTTIKETEQIIDLKKTFKENQTLNGCWFSTTEGSALTMDEYGYRIDFSGVDASEPIIGKYSVDGSQIIFINEGNECKDIEGIYKISFNKKNISLTCKNDECKKRKSVLEADWEWIEI